MIGRQLNEVYLFEPETDREQNKLAAMLERKVVRTDYPPTTCSHPLSPAHNMGGGE